MAASGDFTSFPKICEAGSQVAASTTKTNQGKAKTQPRFHGPIFGKDVKSPDAAIDLNCQAPRRQKRTTARSLSTRQWG